MYGSWSTYYTCIIFGSLLCHMVSFPVDGNASRVPHPYGLMVFKIPSTIKLGKLRYRLYWVTKITLSYTVLNYRCCYHHDVCYGHALNGVCAMHALSTRRFYFLSYHWKPTFFGPFCGKYLRIYRTILMLCLCQCHIFSSKHTRVKMFTCCNENEILALMKNIIIKQIDLILRRLLTQPTFTITPIANDKGVIDIVRVIHT